jgi:hypothetical protein
VCAATPSVNSVTLTDCDDRVLLVLKRMENERMKVRHFLWEVDSPENEGVQVHHWSDAYKVGIKP